MNRGTATIVSVFIALSFLLAHLLICFIIGPSTLSTLDWAAIVVASLYVYIVCGGIWIRWPHYEVNIDSCPDFWNLIVWPIPFVAIGLCFLLLFLLVVVRKLKYFIYWIACGFQESSEEKNDVEERRNLKKRGMWI